VLAPAATPRDIVARLNSDILKLLARRDITERFASQALEPRNLKSEQFTDYIKREVTKMEQAHPGSGHHGTVMSRYEPARRN
jgi:tripartite-type tricarboxylate transporter receptor subunit TctC